MTGNPPVKKQKQIVGEQELELFMTGIVVSVYAAIDK